MEKKKKKKNTIERDRISSLSDSILHHIFSFLNIREAVRSSVLSKRWTDLWTSLPTLNFKYRNVMLDDETERCKRFVDKVFILRDGSNIQKLAFLCPCVPSEDINNDWIISALRRNVQELVIELCFGSQYRLPNCLFNSKSLTILNLNSWGCLILANIPDSMCLPNLKTMLLDSIESVDDDQTNRFFSSCPILESLVITNSTFHRTNLKISLLSLKHLTIQISDSEGADIGPIDGSVKLCTPNLISFHCKDYMEKNYYVLENLSSLFKANIYLTYYDDELWSHSLEVKKNMYAQRMLKFLGELHNVTDLSLSPTILEVVSAPALLESYPIYRNLRSLKIEFCGVCIHTIIYLLQMSPAIETLYINSTLIEKNWEVELSSECLNLDTVAIWHCCILRYKSQSIQGKLGGMCWEMKLHIKMTAVSYDLSMFHVTARIWLQMIKFPCNFPRLNIMRAKYYYWTDTQILIVECCYLILSLPRIGGCREVLPHRASWPQ